MMMKKINKVIVYYEDGTYEEITNSISAIQSEKNKESIGPSPVIPDFRPDTLKIREWPQPTYSPTWVPSTDKKPWEPPYVVTCGSDNNIPLHYSITSDTRDMTSWSFTSTGNADNLNKYTITSTGNGNVDLSK